MVEVREWNRVQMEFPPGTAVFIITRQKAGTVQEFMHGGHRKNTVKIRPGRDLKCFYVTPRELLDSRAEQRRQEQKHQRQHRRQQRFVERRRGQEQEPRQPPAEDWLPPLVDLPQEALDEAAADGKLRFQAQIQYAEALSVGDNVALDAAIQRYVDLGMPIPPLDDATDLLLPAVHTPASEPQAWPVETQRFTPKFEQDSRLLAERCESGEGAPVEVSTEFINNCTNSFHEDRFVRKGVFGCDFYKAIDKVRATHFLVKAGTEVTRLQGVNLCKEVEILSQISHQNIVALIAFASRGSDNWLVFLPTLNGSLAEALHNNELATQLTCRVRIRQMASMAEAIQYLHAGGIFHRAVKSSNMLLTPELDVQLTGFDIATKDCHEGFPESELRTGYCCPRYAKGGVPFDTSCESFSFCVVLLENMFGKLQNAPDNLVIKYVEDKEEKYENILDWRAGTREEWERAGVVLLIKLCDARLTGRRWGMQECVQVLCEARQRCFPLTKDEQQLMGLRVRLQALEAKQEQEEATKEERECCICLNKFDLNAIPRHGGVQCAEGHTTCDECFEQHVKFRLAPDNKHLFYVDKGVCCPHMEQFGAGSKLESCKMRAFSDQVVATHTSPGVYKLYSTATREAHEKDVREQTERNVEARLRADRSNNYDSDAHMRQHIIENILTNKCPRCGQAFYDFEACSALKCKRPGCKCAFCAFCFKDCGRDAHKHVGSCPLNPSGELFVTPATWSNKLRTLKIQKLKDYLDTLREEARQRALQLCGQELRDLRIRPDQVLKPERLAKRRRGA
eukprot:TRINITY_DN76027_c0_g1_i1.p1 TRINITY_DN76027_c0_g1~~TRINITY_DN76027_c0_g1_i1.p1  ORF type:complete len:793 (-),score=121.21 TRINITY_DN76027_c0_g1_i1:345-2723(-)